MSIIESMTFTCDRCHNQQMFTRVGSPSVIHDPRYQAKQAGWQTDSKNTVCPPCLGVEARKAKGCQHEPKCPIWPASWPVGDVRVCQMTDEHLDAARNKIRTDITGDRLAIDRKREAVRQRYPALLAMDKEAERRQPKRQVPVANRFEQQYIKGLDRMNAGCYWVNDNGYGL